MINHVSEWGSLCTESDVTKKWKELFSKKHQTGGGPPLKKSIYSEIVLMCLEMFHWRLQVCVAWKAAVQSNRLKKADDSSNSNINIMCIAKVCISHKLPIPLFTYLCGLIEAE